MRTLLLQSLETEGLLSRTEAAPLWKAKWNCDVEPFGDGGNAIKYLGAYLKRGPVSDSRILGETGDSVVISVKDRKTGEKRAVAIDKAEFVRRYLQHALPRGFHAVRHYGFLHSRAKAKLASIREQLGARLQASSSKPESQDPPAPMLCPRCRKPMGMTGRLARAPPWERSIPKIWLRRQKAAA